MSMNMQEAAVWVDVLRSKPDAAGVAADWFEERDRLDIASYLRNWATVFPDDAADGWKMRELLILNFFDLPAQIRRASREMINRPILSLLVQVPELKVKADEPYEISAPPPIGHVAGLIVPSHDWVPTGIADADGFMDEPVGSLVQLHPYKFGGRVQWRGQRQDWWFRLWAGRSRDGRLYTTPTPSGAEIQVGTAAEIQVGDVMWAG